MSRRKDRRISPDGSQRAEPTGLRARWRRSLLFQYLTIVLLALVLLPFLLPVAGIILNLPNLLSLDRKETTPYDSRETLMTNWHDEAAKLTGADPSAIDARLRLLKQQLPEAAMFWVTGSGETRLALPEQPQLPRQWSVGDSIAFMKQSYAADPYTVVAFIGQSQEQGFMVLQVPVRLMGAAVVPEYMSQVLIAVFVVVLSGFLFTSWSFFYRIRKRLLHLGTAMAKLDEQGIPYPVEVAKGDEIGQLELAFNRMTGELTRGRERERQEERLRKQLIANLSHDLRTPLTIIRSHAYSLRQAALSEQAQASIALIEAKSDDLHRLIEDLLSYTLLSAGKYPLEWEDTDVVRLLRSAAASWYPIFEAEGFKVDVELPEHAVYWRVDPRLLTRIIDNLLQNIVRHAKAGQYVGFFFLLEEKGTALMLEDHGPGLTAASDQKGAGIGLEIVALMAKELGIRYELDSAPGCTRFTIHEPT